MSINSGGKVLFKKYLFTLINAGVDSINSHTMKKRVLITNQLSLTIALITFPYIIIFYISGAKFTGIMVSFIALTYVVIPCLNLWHLTFVSRFLLMLAPNIAVTVYSLAFGESAGIHLYYFANAAIPFVVFSPEEKPIICFGSFLPLLLYLLIWKYGFDGEQWVNVANQYLAIIYPSMVISTFLSLLAALYYFYYSNKKAEEMLFASIQDLQEENKIRSKSEKNLTKKEAELRSLFDNVKDAVFLIDTEHRCTHANRASSRVFGYEMESIVGKKIQDLIGYSKNNLQMQNQVFLTKKPQQMELKLENINGSETWFSLILSPIVENSGELVGITGVGRDVSKEKRIQQQLIDAKENAEKANLAKSSFLAMISHEIRTPLSVIIGYADLLLCGLNDAKSLEEALKSIRKNGQHLLQLINDILDISSIESGKIEMRPVPIFLSHEIDGAVDQLRSMALEKETEIEVIYQTDLPVLIELDPLRLRQIVVNLVSNAIKFTSKGKIEIEVSSRGRRSVSVLVKDTGIGIHKKKWNLLFKPFSQICDEFEKRQNGTGLGLFLSKKIANLMGGDLILKSSVPNLGSVFEFTFSLAVLNQSSEVNSEEKTLGLIPKILLGFPVLLVEDNLEIQNLYAQYLRSFGCRVTVVDNGLDAVRYAKDQKFELILMDIQIPIINGYDAAKDILASDCDVSIIAVTAHLFKGEHQRCLDLGFKDVISKPVTKDLLINRISRWLQHD